MARDTDGPRDPTVESLFTAALALPADERPAYLAGVCGSNLQLRQRVEALLRAHEAPEGFLPEAPGAVDPELLRLTATQTLPVAEAPGDRIGRYKLLEKIGEGGCGAVYMAEQLEPVRRRVAVKIIKLGMDTRQVVARFEAERQALALMDHPNIAKVLDAGATETGRPYFAMELVGGIKVTDYCEKNQLNTRQRLDLFIQVCRAIQHAHQKGVIHRDIKPSNVLVATQDGVPVPKVIDFGIAKATQGRLTDDTVFTAFEQFLGTPAYMSPEQTQVGGLDVDTRSDIYSLGVLLYELLTGGTPFDTKELLAAGLDAMRRTIQEKEPPTPSTRLHQNRLAALSESAGKSEVRNPKWEIDKDLDWIVMKCLEKDRGQRYGTANGLAMDIERHLNNEPVVASPPSRLYKFQKLVSRNRVTAIAIAAVSLSLVLGTVVSAWQAARARQAVREQTRLRQQAEVAQAGKERERQKAQTEAEKSKQVAQFLQDMLQGVGPSKALGRDTTMLKEILDKTAERIGKELTNQPEAQVALLKTLANTYHELGFFQQMEQTARAEAELAQRTPGQQNAELASALEQLGTALCELGDYEQAEAYLRQMLALRRKLFGKGHSEIGDALNSLGLVLYERGNYSEAEAMFREAVGIARKHLGDDAQTATVLSNLGMVLRAEGELAEAEAVRREALAMDRKVLGNEHPDTAASLNDLATVLRDENKFVEAEVMFREALAMRRKLLGEAHPHVALSLHNLAMTLGEEGKLEEAEAFSRQALALFRQLLGNEHPRVASALGGLAFLLEQQGKLDQAETACRECLALQRKEAGDHPHVVTALDHLGRVLQAQGKLAEAEAVMREGLEAARKVCDAESPDLGLALGCLAGVLRERAAQGETAKFAEAEPLFRDSLTILEKKLTDDWRTFNTRCLLGGSLLGQQKYAEAEPLLLSGYQGLKERQGQNPGQANRDINFALRQLVSLYEATGQTNQSAKWKLELEEFVRTQTERAAHTSPPKP